jgi:hypothetical protein
MEELQDEQDLRSISSFTSEYEAELITASEKAEEFHNEFYDSPNVMLTKNYKTKIPEDVLSETLDEISSEYSDKQPFDEDVETYLRSAGIDHKFEPLSPDGTLTGSGDVNVPLRKTNLKALSPVRKVEIREVEVPVELPPSLPGIDQVDYRNFLHQEIGESREMFAMREKIASLLAKADIPRGSRFVSMDTPTIMLLARMFTNKLWFGMSYNKKQEELLKVVSEYIPDLNI